MFVLSSLISWSHVHPVLVHFTVALPLVSVASDLLGKFTDRYSLTPAAWWMLFYASVATPLTAFAGWMWAFDIERLSGAGHGETMEIHQWLGIGLVTGFLLMAIWRGWIFIQAGKPGINYFTFATIVLAALAYQGYLGGKMTLG